MANRIIAGSLLATVTIVAVILIIIFSDMRSSDALIEKPMIKIFNTFPTDGTVHKALNW